MCLNGNSSIPAATRRTTTTSAASRTTSTRGIFAAEDSPIGQCWTCVWGYSSINAGVNVKGTFTVENPVEHVRG